MPIRPLFLLFTIFALAGAPAHAADPVYPPGSRIGIVPAEGLAAGQGFVGFQDAQNKVIVLFAELPPQAYEPTLKSLSEAGKGGQGTTNVRRELLLTDSGGGQLISGDQKIDNMTARKWILLTPSTAQDFIALITVVVPDTAKKAYPDAAVRKMLASVVLRSAIPNEEILGQMPFRITDLADFKYVRAASVGRAVLLTDAQLPRTTPYDGPEMIVSIAPGGPLQSDEHGRFAEQLLGNIPSMKDTRKTFSEPQRIGGLPGYEIRLEGKDAKTGADISLVQWVRFGTSNFVRLIGMAPTEQWKDAFTRFRAVRDGIEYR